MSAPGLVAGSHCGIRRTDQPACRAKTWRDSECHRWTKLSRQFDTTFLIAHDLRPGHDSSRTKYRALDFRGRSDSFADYRKGLVCMSRDTLGRSEERRVGKE